MDKTQRKKQTLEQHEPHYKPELSSWAPEGKAVLAPQVAHIVLPLSHSKRDSIKIIN